MLDCAKGEDGALGTVVAEGDDGALLKSVFVGGTSTLRVRGRKTDTSGNEGAIGKKTIISFESLAEREGVPFCIAIGEALTGEEGGLGTGAGGGVLTSPICFSWMRWYTDTAAQFSFARIWRSADLMSNPISAT